MKNRETKDLNFESDETNLIDDNELNENSSKESNENSDSEKKVMKIYKEKPPEDNDGVWFSTMKSKILVFLLLLLLLISLGIPSGMAAIGYFGKYNGSNTIDSIIDDIENWNPDQEIFDDINNKTDSAYVWYLEELDSQGYFYDGEYENIVEAADKSADNKSKMKKKL